MSRNKPDPEVGERFSLTIERHAVKPLWRLRVRRAGANPSDKATQWAAFPDFSPDLLLVQGDLKRFIFSDIPRTVPMAVRSALDTPK